MGTSQNKTLFTDYEGFVDKFKPKKTTDDCYTPPEVYETVLQWVRENFDIEGAEVVRPFYPGGDFENFQYPENCVVIDNPPFSIFTKIMKWYVSKGIRFFLFAPQLTMAGSDTDVSYIVCNTSVTYENGAVVNTSFATNIPQEWRFWCCPELARRIKSVQKSTKEKKRQSLIRFPDCVTSSAYLGKIADHGIDFRLLKKDCCRIRQCGDKPIFGGGYLMSDKATQQYTEARRRADEERRRADEERRRADEERAIVIALSPQQVEARKRLG